MALLGAVSCCKKTQPGEPALYSAADFDSTIDGKAVSLYTLKNANGMAAQITNYGGIIVDVWVPAKDGAFKDVVLGYPKLADYFVPENTFAGAIRALCEPDRQREIHARRQRVFVGYQQRPEYVARGDRRFQ